MKIIKEKLIQEKKLQINVKCNSALAETLMNEKRNEINNLESLYDSKINFTFDNHYSLHEPTVESVISGQVTKEKLSESKKDNKKLKKKSIKKKAITKKKEIKIKPRKKKNISKKANSITVTKKDIKDTMPSNEGVQSKEVKEVKDIKDNEDEKSGWWSN